jgi:uncharacterized surface anchored protein
MFHLLAALTLFLSALIPMASGWTPAAAQTAGTRLAQSGVDGAPPVVPTPFQVSATGSFGQAAQLEQGSDGVWTGTVVAPEGSYSYRIEIQTNEGSYSLGEGADPDGSDLDVTVDAGDTGIAFRYDPGASDISATGYSGDYSLSIDGYGDVALFPAGDGEAEAYVDGFGGDYPYSVLLDGEPTGQEGVVTLDVGRVLIQLDTDSGAVGAEVVQSASLTVSVTDADGQVATGGCFGVFDGSEFVRQACDADDGFEDGQIVIDFPNGAPAGSLDLSQTLTPEGQETADDQSVNLGGGDAFASVTLPAGEDTGGEPSADATVNGMPSADESATDEGRPSRDGDGEPSDEGNGDATLGTLEITVVDADGNLLSGAIFGVQNEAGYFEPFADDVDGDLDDTVTIEGVLPGSNTVFMTTAPDGRDVLPEQTATVEAGEVATVQFVYEDEEATGQPSPEQSIEPAPSEDDGRDGDGGDGTATLTIQTLGPDGTEVGGAAYSITIGGETYGPFGDDDGDGVIQVDGVPAGSVTVTMTTAPDGQTLLPDQTVDVTAGEDQTTAFRYDAVDDAPAGDESPSTEASPSPDEGAGDDTLGVLEITVVDADGDPLDGAVFAVQNDAGYFEAFANDVDGANDDVVRIEGVLPGSNTIFMIEAPDGESLLPEQTVEVEPGGTMTVEFSYGAGDEPSADASPSVDSSPSPDVSPSPEPSAPADGRLILVVTDGDGNVVGNACFGLLDPATNQPVEVLNRVDGTLTDAVCDEDGDVADDGRVGLFGIADGTYILTQTRTADGYEPAEDQEITFFAGGTQELAIVNEPAEAPATDVTITRQDGGGNPIGGSCVELRPESGEPIGPVCDDESGDAAGDEPGTITITDVPHGAYQVVETRTPETVEPAEATTLDVTEDGDNSATVQTENVEQFGEIAVEFVVEGENQPGLCATVQNEFGLFGPFCDDQFDGAVDGVLIIPQVEPGENTVTITAFPEGFGLIEGQDETRTTEVVAGETAVVTYEGESILGSIQVTVVDAGSGDPIPGTCVQITSQESGPVGDRICDDVGDGGTGDADPAPGAFTLEDVPEGEYLLLFDELPAEYQGPDAGRGLDITVSAGETATAEHAIAALPSASPSASPSPATGTIDATITDLDSGEPIAGTCLQLVTEQFEEVGEPVCDNVGEGETGDANPEPGAFTLTNVDAGVYILIFNDLPEAYRFPDAELGPRVEVTAGQIVTAGHELPLGDLPEPEPSASEDVSSSPSAPVESSPSADGSLSAAPSPAAEGAIEVILQDEDGETLEGLCVSLIGAGDTVVAEVCDNTDADGTDSPGVIRFDGVPAGNYVVAQSGDLPDDLVAAADMPPSAVVQVIAGETVTVTLVVQVAAPDDREVSVVVAYTDGFGRLIGGASFSLNGTEIADGGDGDADGTTGRIRFDGIPAGSYTIEQTEAPAGYELSEDVAFTVDGDTPLVVTVPVIAVPIPDLAGTLIVETVDSAGTALPGACYVIERNGSSSPRICDGNDGERDGIVTFEDVEPGTLRLRQVQTPIGYSAGGNRDVTIVGGETTTIQVVNPPRPGRITIDTVDGAGEALAGSCFRLTGPATYEFCDSDDVQGADGTTRFGSVVPGDYTVEQTVVPAGYAAGSADPIRIQPGGAARVTVTNQLLPPPDDAGDLSVAKVDGNGDPLASACFSLLSGDRTVGGPVCDGQDGRNDGTTTITDIEEGDYTLRETRTPTAAYLPAEDRNVSIVAGETTTIEVVNELRDGGLRVTVVNPQGQPLAGACFDIVDDGVAELCTNSAGQVVFTGVNPGTYAVDQVGAPTGYVAVVRQTGVVVNPGVTTDLRIVNQRAAPPANTGTLQLTTFYCPAGTAGERTVIFDSSNTGPKQLADTASCGVGNATYTFIRTGGEGGFGEFAVGNDGFYQASVRSGTYNLVQVQPELGGQSSETVRIDNAQLTQVIVVNYVAPPPPAPAAIDITSFTCPAGFEGTLYEDFAATCSAAGNLTNGVTYRISGPLTDRASTGAGGQAGRVVFDEIPAGSYYVEQQTSATQQIVYSFCGLDSAAPASKRLGIGANVATGAGQTVFCRYYTVPAVVSDTTGAIVIQKYSCPVEDPSANYDFYANCGPQSTPAQFDIALYNGENRDYEPVTSGTTNVDGLLTFARLIPGTYALEEAGEGWCYAESDSVNTNGDVVVRPNTVSKVFIFNCSAVGQPNTGVGTAASALVTGTTVPAALGFAALISAAIAAAWVVRRRLVI